MNTFSQLMTTESVAHSIFVLSLVIILGLLIGGFRLFRINLGVAGVLFSGLLFGHFGVTIHAEILEFARELGLILFVYTIGMHVGPSFLESFKKEGLALNILAAAVVIGGALLVFLIHKILQIDLPTAVGLFSGATTNTPSLAAAQQALKEVSNSNPDLLKMPALGYAIAYPFGVIGIILTMIVVRSLFKIDVKKEAAQYAHGQISSNPKIERMNLKVQNPNLNGIALKKIPSLDDSEVTISRIMHDGVVQVAKPSTKVHLGDTLLAVGPREKLDEIRIIIGTESETDLTKTKSVVTSRQVVVSRKRLVGKSLDELDLPDRYGVTITRISRGENEFLASPDVRIHFGDRVIVVGEEDSIEKFSSDAGDSLKALSRPQLVPLFIGIAFGILLGSIPIYIGGMSAPVKLGLAGGPLIVAIILGKIGRIGRVTWYLPTSANYMLREFGISLFLACVGLRSGDQFLKAFTAGNGWLLLASGVLITILPIMLAAMIARIYLRMNYLTLCGFLAGSMTDPPALAFANREAQTNAQVIAYANVYPLVMILRVIAAQAMIIIFTNN